MVWRGYSKISDGFKAAGLPIPSVKSHCGGTMVSFMRGFDVVNGKKIGNSDVDGTARLDVCL